MRPRIDPKLKETLQAEQNSARPVDAYVEVEFAEEASKLEQLEDLFARVLALLPGEAVPLQWNYLDLLEVVHVQASSNFLKLLLRQPEVLSAQKPPHIAGSAFMKPKNPRILK